MLWAPCSSVLPVLLWGDLSKEPQGWWTLRRTGSIPYVHSLAFCLHNQELKTAFGSQNQAPCNFIFSRKGSKNIRNRNWYGCNSPLLFLLFLLNRTANKELDNLVLGLIRPKLSIPPSFLLCRKLLVFFIAKFSNIFLCIKSSLYAVVQENPGSQESCSL